MAGWHNPPLTWSQFERTLSDRRPGEPPAHADGGESPGWSRKRLEYVAPAMPVIAGQIVPYAELHVHSNYSFLDGASAPEDLLEEARRLGLHGMALTDHDGLYGIVRMAEAAEKLEIKTIFGAELSLDLSRRQNGQADPHGTHLLVLARREEGYHRLAGAITSAQLADGAEKGHPIYDLEALAEQSAGHWLILSGCRKSLVRQALQSGGPDEAERALAELVRLFGRDNVVVELFDHGNPLDTTNNDTLFSIATRVGLATIATTAAHYATPAQRQVATALAAVRAQRSLDELDAWLPASGGAHLRSGAEMAARFARYPGVIARTVTIANDLEFELRAARPKLPTQEVPVGHTPMSWLRELVWQGVARKYPRLDDDGRARLERELDVIELKDFPGYFLIVYDIVAYARSRGILCQGRGSAANSAVCYTLDITAVDSIKYKLPFERFLSSLREEEPDIDVDFDSDRREEVIQYVFEKYGRRNAAQVANVITYRPKNAVRDMAKALGYSAGQQDAWSKHIDSWSSVTANEGHDIPQPVIDLAQQVLKFPRHLGIHSGGMVLTDRPVGEVVPIERARMANRTVLQWDKDDCAWMGLVKFDLLGLGMLAALQHSFDLIEQSVGEKWLLETVPKEEKGVYDMLCRADAIGIFQVESRAQLGTLPRLKPREFYDLAIEIALIRPGPIQGGAVHPYMKRRANPSEISYLHPKLEPVLKRTLGVPLFQEQVMQMAMAVGGCTPEDADLLRRAMGSKRGTEKISALESKLFAGMAENGIVGDDAENIYAKIKAFANFGFAESHSISFALLVYVSSWIKLHYPVAFLAALLRAQPMGFYSPASLSADARRHGVEIRRPDIRLSGITAGLEPVGLAHSNLAAAYAAAAGTAAGDLAAADHGLPTGRDSCLLDDQPPVGEFDITQPDESAAHRRDSHRAVRLGLADVTSIGVDLATRIVAERDRAGDFLSQADLVRRVGLTTAQLEALASAGAFDTFGDSRRQAIWEAGEAAHDREQYLPGSIVSVQPPLLPLLTAHEQLNFDLWATGISPDDHPIAHLREQLAARGVLRASQLAMAESGRRIEIGGVVVHRQRPSTAGGVTFMNIEDETGMVNVICTVGVWNRYRRVARLAPAMIIRGILERSPEGVINLIADAFEAIVVVSPLRSRDFH